MIHGAAALTVFLIVKVEPDPFALQEGGERRGMRDDLAVTEETDVHPAELDRPSGFAGGCHGVFTWAKEKEESNDG
jgi:hypothetical protein